MSTKAFVVFPSQPSELRNTVEASVEELSSCAPYLDIRTWAQIGAPGRFIVEGILQRIDEANFVVADITRLNFNVTFEIGYAIGRSKRVVLTVNEALSPHKREISQLGIYDTLFYASYENASALAHIVGEVENT